MTLRLSAARSRSTPSSTGDSFAGFDSDLLADLVPLGVLSDGPEYHVTRAYDLALRRNVVVKVPLTDVAAQRVRSEAFALARLSRHPAIVNVFRTVSDSGGRTAMVLEFAEGEALSHRLSGSTPMTDSEIAVLGIWLAGALASAHEFGMIHGDVKPANVIVTTSGLPALVDFGSSISVGGRPHDSTPGWSAPEVAAAHALGPSADVFSLGALLAACGPSSDSLRGLVDMMRSNDPQDRPELGEVAAVLTRSLPTGLAPPFVVVEPDENEFAAADGPRDAQEVRTRRSAETGDAGQRRNRVTSVGTLAALAAGVAAGAIVPAAFRAEPGVSTTTPVTSADCPVAVDGNRFPGPVRCYEVDPELDPIQMFAPGSVWASLDVQGLSALNPAGADANSLAEGLTLAVPARVTLGAFNSLGANGACSGYTTDGIGLRGVQTEFGLRESGTLFGIQLYVAATPDEARQLVPVLALQVGLDVADCRAWGLGHPAPGAKVEVERDDWGLRRDADGETWVTWNQGANAAMIAHRGSVVVFAFWISSGDVADRTRTELVGAAETALMELNRRAAQ